MPNISCDNCVSISGVHLDKPKNFFWMAMIFLSNFLMAGSEYGIA